MKFEEHNNQLFLMLEEPVPLTDDAKMPCLVRLIQDDTMLGKANKINCHPDTLAQKRICSYLTEDGLFFDGYYTYHYEIIGTFVEEGSAEWALWRMMQGDKVMNVEWIKRKSKDLKYCYCENGMLVYNPEYVLAEPLPIGDFLTPLIGLVPISDGWQIYKESEPLYKVGDWVECVAKQGQRKLVDYLGGMRCYKTNCGEVISPREILHKISPFEVIVTIGCLNGTVEKAYGEKKGTFILNGLSGQRNVLWLSMLDAATCVLVESLLKAQDEEK